MALRGQGVKLCVSGEVGSKALPPRPVGPGNKLRQLVIGLGPDHKIYGRLAWQGWRIGQSARFDPKRHEYTDLALQPVMDDDMDKLSLFAETAGGGAAVDKKRGEDVARAKIAAAQNLQRLEAAE